MTPLYPAIYEYTYRRAVIKATILAYLLTLFVFGICFLDAPLASGGWQWDAANALGFMGFAGMLYLFVDVGAGRRNRIHQWVSYTVCAALVGHVAWFLVADPTIWHYLAWDAPWYMLSGLAALFAVIAVVLLALPTWRRWFGQSRSSFRNWHYTLSLLGVVGAALHILGSGFYVSGLLEVILYAALCTAVALIGRFEHTRRPTTPTSQLAGALLVMILFVGIKAIPA